MVSRYEILNLEKGEVVAYDGGDGVYFLYVDHVDKERGVVSGKIISPSGVNEISIDTLAQDGIDVAKWGKGTKFKYRDVIPPLDNNPCSLEIDK